MTVDWTGPRTASLRYVIVTGIGEVSTLDTVLVGGRISRSLFAPLQESGDITTTAPLPVDARVRIYYDVTTAEGSASIPLATLFAATDEAEYGDGVTRHGVTLLSSLLPLSQSLLLAPTTIPAGTVVTTAVQDYVTVAGLEMVPSSAPGQLASALSFDAGDSVLTVINALLDAAGLWGARIDGAGRVVIVHYVAPANTPPVWTFVAGPQCIFTPNVVMSSNASEIPNRYTLIASSADSMITASAANHDPASPFSVGRRGRFIDAVETVDGAATAVELQARAEMRLAAASALAETIEITHAWCPVAPGDVVRLIWDEHDMDVYAEITAQEHSLTPSLTTKTTARRIRR